VLKDVHVVIVYKNADEIEC